jgi:hypothetical protein
MRFKTKLAVLLGLLLVPVGASAAVIGGYYYYPQYDWAEFFAATDGRNFQVILAGNPFPGVDPNTAARALLPVLQDAKPRPALTFTYDAPVERPRPYYRLVLIFNSAPDLGSGPVCNGVTRFGQPRSGTFYVYAVYCRNDQPLSEATAWTPATGPTDRSVDQLFRELFQVVFTDGPYGRNIKGTRNRF